MDQNTIKRIKSVYTELEAGNTAVVAKEDMEAMTSMVNEGYYTEHIKEILKSKKYYDQIMSSKLADVEFTEEDKELIKEFIENGGKMKGVAKSIKSTKDSNKSLFRGAAFKKEDLSGVILLDQGVVALIRRNLETPLYLYFDSVEEAKTAFEDIKNECF